MKSSTPTSPRVRPRAPSTSTRPPARRVLSGTHSEILAKHSTPSAADIQNSMCQSATLAMYAARGMPTAPPTPMVALMRATAVPSRSAGSTSRMIAMPMGITPVAIPCSPRPRITPTIEVDSAATTEPRINSTNNHKMTFRLPYMSPSRPAIGVHTEAVSRVIVTTHAVSSRDAFSRTGSSVCNGTISVYMNAAVSPANASEPTIAHPGARQAIPRCELPRIPITREPIVRSIGRRVYR